MIAPMELQIKEAYLKYNRLGLSNPSHCSADKLATVDKSVIQGLLDILCLKMRTLDLQAALPAIKQSPYAPLLMNVLTHTRRSKKGMKVQREAVASPKLISEKYQHLFPFVISRLAVERKAKLLGFKNNGERITWYAEVGRTPKLYVDCVDYAGKSVRVPIKKLNEMGYTELMLPDAQLKKLCVKDIGKVGAADIEKVELYVASKVIPKIDRTISLNRLSAGLIEAGFDPEKMRREDAERTLAMRR
jgi:hypothetical protein